MLAFQTIDNQLSALREIAKMKGLIIIQEFVDESIRIAATTVVIGVIDYDPDNLLATSSSANRSKGAKGPDQWLPSINKCSYAQRWKQLIKKYGVTTTAGEMEAIAKVCQ